MGRRDKSYSRDMIGQVDVLLSKKQAFGQSKRQAQIDGTAQDKIFSISTYNTYKKHCKYYADWLMQTHPECKTLKKGRPFVEEFLRAREAQENISPYTLHLEKSALCKLYSIPPDELNYTAPTRHRVDIKRSRGEAVRDKHFSELNNWELVQFAKGTGLRRKEISALNGQDCITMDGLQRIINILANKDHLTKREEEQLRSAIDVTEQFPNETHFVWVREGKGGRPRYAPIIGKYKQQIVDRIMETSPSKKVWQYVSTNADIHSYRAEYATKIYKTYARDIKDIPYDKLHSGTGKMYQGDVYFCRKDEKGKKLDKKAMLKASKALGHNRICVVSDHYLRGI